MSFIFDARVKIEVGGVVMYTTPNTFKSEHGLAARQTRTQASGNKIKRIPITNIEDTKGMMEFATASTAEAARYFKQWQKREGQLTVKASWTDEQGENQVFVLSQATLLGDLTITGSPDSDITFSFEGNPIQDTLGA